MSTHVVDRVDSWDERSFSGGYRELHELADDDFSGVVRADGAELYMTRGVVVGIRMGDIEDFENASGTTYEAPAEALPLLAVMQERSDEVRAKYYSEDTSIEKVDKTLSDGGFTGYIELSENVLSGDYYLVYHAGTSMAVAFVGESSKLIDGDEAFDTANDEVGIYQVRPVDIEPIEIPEPEDDAGAAAGAGSTPSADDATEPPADDAPSGAGVGSETAGAGTGAANAGGAAAGGAAAGAAEDPAQAESEPASGTAAAQEEPADEAGAAEPAETSTASQESRSAQENQTARTDEQTSEASGRAQASREEETAADTTGTADATQSRSEDTTRQEPTTQQDKRARTSESTRETNGSAASRQQESARSERAGASSHQQQATNAQTSERANQQSRTKQQTGSPQNKTPGGQARQAATTGSATGGNLETRAIPSLDPNQTAIPDQGSAQPTPGGTTAQQPAQDAQTSQPAPDTSGPQQQPPQQNGRAQPEPQEPAEPAPPADQQEPQQQAQPQQGQSQPQGAPAGEVPTERVEELEAELDEKTAEIDRLETELAETSEERDDLQRQLEELEAERDELAAEVEELENELSRLEEEFGAATNAERRLTPGEALAGTDIFVRYHSKGDATLEKAHGSSTRREDVNDNMRLEKHTQFDADSASVGGQSYAEFLETTLEYQFVQWVVRDLLFEIRDTGHEKALRDLYDVLPQVDRAELSGVIRVTYTEDGQETQTEESFDVVLRDRMGNPLLVANLNDTREATTEAMMEGLITSAERVGLSSDTFAGAFYVTESFFDPSALEIAEESTKGGILSRDKRKSFVNLSRKNGYHLCLVEARNENFHLAVPEL